uniref:Uncharacterized protein n=1 Tax=Noctiluca scintillans TaxID=2966 RepID=A0A7S1AGX0_NOCSC
MGHRVCRSRRDSGQTMVRQLARLADRLCLSRCLAAWLLAFSVNAQAVHDWKIYSVRISRDTAFLVKLRARLLEKTTFDAWLLVAKMQSRVMSTAKTSKCPAFTRDPPAFFVAPVRKGSIWPINYTNTHHPVEPKDLEREKKASDRDVMCQVASRTGCEGHAVRGVQEATLSCHVWLESPRV